MEGTAELAKKFAEPFGAGDWGYLAGLWHDLGKYSAEFQKKLFDANGIECHLETKPGKVIHSQAGGHLAQQVFHDQVARVFCWLIMGHHAGLADYSSDKTGAKALEPKMRTPDVSSKVLLNVPESIRQQEEPGIPELLRKETPADVALLIRMLFSCVVDADFIDTEAFVDKDRKRLREKERPTLGDLLVAFDTHMATVCENATSTEVNRIRADVLAQCRAKAEREPGIFSLTVPTGGGKTLSSLAFALKHAKRWGKRRIIYVIPYTSIIEQTALVFRDIPGFADAVLEHHSSVAEDDESKESVRRRLAAENWDTPIVVTTAVQFFESVYASKTSRCRKLHNIADSVIIFDEAQCLPPAYVRPCVFAVRELQRHYGVTPVLCTATQPVLTRSEKFDFKFREGFEGVVEIIEEPDEIAGRLSRVDVVRHKDLLPVDLPALADAIQSEAQSALCIVNRKRDCRELAMLLPDDRTVHLSANMCAAHRLGVLEAIRKRLEPGEPPLYVISTSLVEAGVDLDFPVVYRALAGLDSIAQAAGRCNREGKLSRGKTVVFLPEAQPDYVEAAASLARSYVTPEKLEDIFLPKTFDSYFAERFFQLGAAALDKRGILALLGGNLDFYFRAAAEQFRLIDDDWQLPLIVPYGEAPALIGKLVEWDARSVFRKLQRYTVNVSKPVMRELLDHDYANELSEYPGTYYLHTSVVYTERFGFVPPAETDSIEPEAVII
ncbi:MAG: CRISPR-associated endonuclease Cas3'' [Kiritimatiellia bacterium]